METIAIGDELLSGTISDTNSTYIAAELMELGYRLARETVIADDIQTIIDTLKERSKSANMVFVFGGLGPTSDDKTVDAVCKMSGAIPVEHPLSRERIERAYRERGQGLNPHALKQALYPDVAKPLANSVGMAPGFWWKLGNTDLFFLPGVPLEMMAIFQEQIKPWLSTHLAKQSIDRIQTRLWKCIGIYESQLQVAMDPIEKLLPTDAWLGYRTHFPENHVTLYRLGAKTFDLGTLTEQIDTVLSPWTFTTSKEEMEEIVLRELKLRNWTVAFAESCTAGLACQKLSQIPGASNWLWGGVNTYQLTAKKELLAIGLDRAEDAVSEETTRDMARAILRISGADVAAAVTGFLGPDEGSAAARKGTVFCCVMGRNERILEKRLYVNPTNRPRAQTGAAIYLLDLVRCFLLAP